MLREAHIPILLWLPAAILLHLATGGGAVEVAKTVAEKAAILKFSRDVRAQIRSEIPGDGKPTEIEVLDEPPAPDPKDPVLASKEAPADDEAAEPAPPERAEAQKPPEPKPPEPPKDKPPEPPKPPEPKPPEAPKVAVKEDKPPEGPAKPPQELPKPDGRIAIQNDPTLDPNQKDNPNANRIADNANTTDHEEQAKIRSYDQNSPKPTGGGNPHDGPNDEPGNADEEQRGHSVDAPGDGPPKPGSDSGPEKPPDEPIARSPLSAERPSGQKAVPGEKSSSAQDAGKGPQMPEAVSSDKGGYSLDPDGGDGRPQQDARRGRKGRRGRQGVDGEIRIGPPMRFSVNAYGLQDALGAQNLRAEQEHARNVRLNKHRGVFKGIDFQKYRAAIENYDPVVKEGNQTSLNAARVPFASYINRMHNKIHPIFADGFLASLTTHPDQRLGDMKLFTHLEIVLDGRTGKLINAGVVRASGVTALEVAALRSVEEASPYGKPPDVIVSPDGRVYLHWEFYRDPFYACTSKFARPYLLKAAPKPEPSPLPPPAPPPPEDAPKYGANQ